MGKGLVADIGGTNVRFALIDTATERPSFDAAKRYSTKDHSDICAAAQGYLAEQGFGGKLAGLVFGVAGPVTSGTVHLTNAGWTISEENLRRKFDADFARVVNDYDALAEAIPVFEPEDMKQIGSLPFDGRLGGTVAIVGPGTGLGVGGLLHSVHGAMPLVTEGGHSSFAPTDDLEIEVLNVLRRKFGRHVSNERILSGPGLLNLYQAMAENAGREMAHRSTEDITTMACTQADSFEASVLNRFCAILGSFAGDLALSIGARNGVLIGGGILPNAINFFFASDFRNRFEDKGRFGSYMKAIPTALIIDKHAGLRGAASILRNELVKE